MVAQELVAAQVPLPPSEGSAHTAAAAASTTTNNAAGRGAGIGAGAASRRRADPGGIGTGSGQNAEQPFSSSSSSAHGVPLRRSVIFGLDVKRGHLYVHDGRWSSGGLGRGADGETRGPFKALRDVPLAVLVASDPMLARPLRLALHGLLMRLLVDQEFKRDFALTFTRLYQVCRCRDFRREGEAVRRG